MDNTDYIITYKKGQHLTSKEKHEIKVRLKDNWSKYKIAKHLNRSHNTIKGKINRSTVFLYNGNVKRYKSDTGKEVYLEHRQNSRKNYR